MDEVENTKKYNFIYSKLVESEDDLVGLVAYGVYKQHKISFIYINSNDGWFLFCWKYYR